LREVNPSFSLGFGETEFDELKEIFVQLLLFALFCGGVADKDIYCGPFM